MRTDLEWFRTFKAVFETGTMSDAAKDLSISQPGVSLHLNALEAYIGFPLFKRNTRKMIPNERAKILYQQVCDSLVKLEEVERKFGKKKKEGRGTLSIGMYASLYRQCLEAHIPEFGFNVIMHLETTENLIPLLAHGAVDLAVLNQEVPLRNICYELLGTVRLVLVAGPGTDISGFSGLPERKKRLSQWLESQLWYNTADREQLNLFAANAAPRRDKLEKLEKAMDGIRDKFGREAISSASNLRRGDRRPIPPGPPEEVRPSGHTPGPST